MSDRHAVFATTTEHRRFRVSNWLDWSKAQELWSKLDAKRGDLADVKFFEVRQSGDPKYSQAEHAPYIALTPAELPEYVKLSRWERRQLLKIGREAGRDSGDPVSDAADAMFTELCNDPRWGHLEGIVISDYAWGAAHFCFPHAIGW